MESRNTLTLFVVCILLICFIVYRNYMEVQEGYIYGNNICVHHYNKSNNYTRENCSHEYDKNEIQSLREEIKIKDSLIKVLNSSR